MDKKLRERKYMEAAKMRSQGYSLRVIGEKVGLGTTTVWKMLRNFDLDSELDDTNEVEKMNNRNRSGKDSSKSREQQLMEENARLKAELKEARKERDFQNLRADVLDEMMYNLEWLLTGRGKMYRDNLMEEGSDSAQLALFPLPSPSEPRQIERILVF